MLSLNAATRPSHTSVGYDRFSTCPPLVVPNPGTMVLLVSCEVFGKIATDLGRPLSSTLNRILAACKVRTSPLPVTEAEDDRLLRIDPRLPCGVDVGRGDDTACPPALRYEILTLGLNTQMSKRAAEASSSEMTKRYVACACASSSRSDMMNTDRGNRTGLGVSDFPTRECVALLYRLRIVFPAQHRD